MSTRAPRTGEAGDAIALGDRAVDDLRFIRRTMEHGSAFTAVPGWGGVAMGVSALGAAWWASGQTTPERWLGVWMLDALLAIAIGAWAIRKKASGAGIPIFREWAGDSC